METQTLKSLISQYGLVYRDFADTGLDKSQMSLIVNHDRWPIKADRGVLQEKIEDILRGRGASDSELANIWPDNSLYKLKTQLLQGGPAVLPETLINKIGLKRDPFWNEMSGVEDVFLSRAHADIYNKMYDAAQNAKFIGVFGEVGSGKTILKSMLIEKLLSERNYLVSEPLISEKTRLKPPSIADAMTQDFLYEFGSIQQSGKLSAPRSLEAKVRFLARILKHSAKQGRRCVVIIDEAHDLPIETLKAMKRFHEIQDGFKKMLGIILIGQPEMHDAITKDYRIREVAARIDLMEMRSAGIDIAEYLNWKIARAGAARETLLDDGAVAEIRRKLNGHSSPLLVNTIASHAIKKGFDTNTLPATAEVVELAFKEMGG